MRLIALVPLVLLLAAAPAAAQGCGVRAGYIDFGQVVRNDGEVVRGEVHVLCDRPARFDLSLSAGHGDYRLRRMRAPGGRQLEYNVYVDPALRQVWGDGLTAGTARLSGQNDGRRSTILPVYARLLGGQRPGAGLYSDSLVIVIEP